MGSLSVLTILVVTATNLFMVAAALPLLMGRHVSASARYVQASLLVQALSWVTIIAAGYWFDPFFSVLSIGFSSLALLLVYRALGGWLGPRPAERWLLALVVLTPLGYGLSWGNYQLRVGWSNFLLAAQMLILARAALWPAPGREVGARWRWVLCGCYLAMAVLTAWRGVLGAFFTELYPSFRSPHPVNIVAQIAINVTLVLGTVAVLVAWREEAEGQLRELAMTDALTGVLNRRGFNVRAEAMFAAALRHKLPLSVLMLDIDHFKRINDSRGHEAGDQALRLFARLLSDSRRGDDLAGRLGGEEFCVLLSHSDAASAQAFDRRLRMQLPGAALAALGFPLDYSAGLAVRGAEDMTLAQLLARADAALYQAKQRGRARLEMAA
ncbi:MAG TPA: GGDEF domain-containing protein [Burkholderiaceae bacterium]|nr:GGDEF domain-containing protein [Burkholderiaceae bacterium]